MEIIGNEIAFKEEFVMKQNTKERLNFAKGIMTGIVLALTMVTTVVFATPQTREIVFGINDITVNGRAINFSDDERPFILGGLAFLPVRVISDELGLGLDWNPVTQTINITSWEHQTSQMQPTLSQLQEIEAFRNAIALIEQEVYYLENHIAILEQHLFGSTPVPPVYTNQRTHVVQAGENLSRISQNLLGSMAYIDLIMEANNLTNHNIHIGQILIIPDR